MEKKRQIFYVITVVLLLFGAVGSHLLPGSLGNTVELDLENFPTSIGPWKGVDTPFSSDIAEALGADNHLARQYVNGLGQVIWFYTGYFQNQRSSLRGHVPEVCYPAQGWTIERFQDHEIEVVKGNAKGKIKLKKLLAKRGEGREIVYYWWQSGNRVISSKTSFQIELLLRSIISGSSSGLLVEVSTIADKLGSDPEYLEDFSKIAVDLLSELQVDGQNKNSVYRNHTSADRLVGKTGD